MNRFHLEVDSFRSPQNQEKTMSVSYSCVLLDSGSKEKVAKRFPEISLTHCHHMTITLGPLVHRKGKYDLSCWTVGEEVSLRCVAIRRSPCGSVMALRVLLDDDKTTRTVYPHITLYIADGHKPKESNQLTESWESLLAEPLFLNGVVTEIPNKRSK